MPRLASHDPGIEFNQKAQPERWRPVPHDQIFLQLPADLGNINMVPVIGMIASNNELVNGGIR
jgi:hypothetical protein